jgi:hypothetical protein
LNQKNTTSIKRFISTKKNSYFLETFAIYNPVSILMLMNLIFLKNEFMIFIDIRVMMFIVQYVLMIYGFIYLYLMCRFGPLNFIKNQNDKLNKIPIFNHFHGQGTPFHVLKHFNLHKKWNNLNF